MRRWISALRVLALLALVLTAGSRNAVADPPLVLLDSPQSSVGAAIYRTGILRSGSPLTGARTGAQPATGEQAACINCHRRSGLGSQEASGSIPPITGRFLFHQPARNVDQAQLPYIPGARLQRQAYTEATLARAIRNGVDPDGRELSYLMPRFALEDADMAALVAHLRSLDRAQVPGVSSSELHFATIVAPDADPIKRRAMLDVMRQFFQDRNTAPRGASGQTMIASGNTASTRSMFKVNRLWVLHVWELEGDPATWPRQLERKFAETPVFAVISGIGGRTWAPVADFCERREVPCLFSNVERPPDGAEHNFHTLYFSRGVLLEADLIASDIHAGSSAGPKRVLQVFRAGDIGESGAAAVAAHLKSQGVEAVLRILPHGAPSQAVTAAVRDSSAVDATVLWLRPADLAALDGAPAPNQPIYVSGVMGGLDAAPLPKSWQDHAHMAYPFDLPDRRRVRIDYALAWFRIRNVPVIAEQVQLDTYLACGLLSETLKHMIDAFVPDYLIERLEDTLEHRTVTGYYPHLGLGPHQRFASKGGFLVHYDAANAGRLIPDGDWITP